MTKNPCYTSGKKITPKGLMLHSVGVPQPKASVFVESWNKETFDDACVHAFIDGNTGDVYQTLPWNHRGWHGGKSSNNTHIGVEMCEPSCIKYIKGSTFTCSDVEAAKEVAKRTYESAVELFAFLCGMFNLNPLADGVILSHSEGHSRGISTNHADPEHLWSQLGLNYTMNQFRNDVRSSMNKVELLTSANDITWELNHSFFPITETEKFVKELDEAKRKNSSLYWGYYKLVNKIK